MSEKNNRQIEWRKVPGISTPESGKYASIIDFARCSLSELENQTIKYFPELEAPKQILHLSLLSQLSFSLLGNDWGKDEILNFIAEEIDEAIDESDGL